MANEVLPALKAFSLVRVGIDALHDDDIEYNGRTFRQRFFSVPTCWKPSFVVQCNRSSVVAVADEGECFAHAIAMQHAQHFAQQQLCRRRSRSEVGAA